MNESDGSTVSFYLIFAFLSLIRKIILLFLKIVLPVFREKRARTFEKIIFFSEGKTRPKSFSIRIVTVPALAVLGVVRPDANVTVKDTCTKITGRRIGLTLHVTGSSSLLLSVTKAPPTLLCAFFAPMICR